MSCASVSSTWYLTVNVPKHAREFQGVRQKYVCGQPIISDSSREPEELPAATIVRSRVERQNTPRPAGGLSPAHFPAAHESAVSVSISASSSLASCGLRGFRLHDFAD